MTIVRWEDENKTAQEQEALTVELIRDQSDLLQTLYKSLKLVRDEKSKYEESVFKLAKSKQGEVIGLNVYDMIADIKSRK